MELPDDARNLGGHRDLHLHRLQDHDHISLGDQLTLFDHDLPDVRRDFRADLVHDGSVAATSAGSSGRFRAPRRMGG